MVYALLELVLGGVGGDVATGFGCTPRRIWMHGYAGPGLAASCARVASCRRRVNRRSARGCLDRWLPAAGAFAACFAPRVHNAHVITMFACTCVQSQKLKGANHSSGASAEDFKKIKLFTMTRALSPDQGAWTDFKAPPSANILFGQVSSEHATIHFA